MVVSQSLDIYTSQGVWGVKRGNWEKSDNKGTYDCLANLLKGHLFSRGPSAITKATDAP